MIRTGLGGGIRRAGCIGCGFGEQVIRAFQVAIHLIGGNMVKAECALLRRRQVTPITAGRFEQAVSADNIGLDKVRRPIDGAIHMGFGRQVHYRRGLKLAEYHIERSTVADIYLIEAIAWRIGHRSQRLEIASIGKFVEVGDLCGSVSEQVANHCGANKAGTAGDENAGNHRRLLFT
ncbi:hypothetical protein D3C80_1135120 [compost metagenome]